MATAAPTMTVEQLLAMPDDDVDRELIRGELRELPMTVRNRQHSRVEAANAKILGNWLDAHPDLGGEITSGEAGFRLRRDPDSGVGIDVAFVSREVIEASPADFAFYEGPPVLAAEILSPSDTMEAIEEEISLYLECGVVLVWILQPRFQTITVYSVDAPPRLYNDRQDIDAAPHLPGFLAPVARLFGA